ncbi:MAG: redoxin family protein [Tepidisphaerales bacterium]
MAGAPAVLGVMLASSVAAAQSLKVGDPAPPLKVGTWVKGEPVTSFEPGTVYVLEFWATWCGPCVAAIPHVTELQKKYAGKVVVIGQNVWEQDESRVAPFVEQMGDKMDYRVVLDDKTSDPQGAMATTWMAAAGQRGIPASFIVDQQGKIAWIGHPMRMDGPLAKIVAGEYDAQAEEAAAKVRAERMEALETRLRDAIAARDAEKAMAVIDEVLEVDPSMAKQAPLVRYQVLQTMGASDKAAALADDVFASMKDDSMRLNQFAWGIAIAEGQPGRDLPLALRCAERAAELTNRNDADILDTLARVHWEMGAKDKATAVQAEAVEKATDPEMKAAFQQTLERYKAGQWRSRSRSGGWP